MKTPRQPEDPILSPQEMAWTRQHLRGNLASQLPVRPQLKIIQITPRRIGARQSNWRQALEQRAKQPA